MGWHEAREATIIGVIRGDTALAALADTDLAVPCAGAHPPCHRDAKLRIHVTIQDIARGLVAYHARPEELYDWAWALLSWDFIEIAETACWRDPAAAGGAALTALRNAASRLPVDPETECIVAQVAAGSCPVAARPARSSAAAGWLPG